MLDDVKEYGDSGVKMRVYRPKRFIERWNTLVQKGKNPMEDMLRGKQSLFRDDFNENPVDDKLV